MKLGAIYNSYYDTHLLEYSISCLKPFLSYVVVVHQTINHDGLPHQEGSLERLKTLKKKGLVDRVIIINPRKDQSKIDFIIYKRNLGLSECKEVGCTHIMPMDADEFYDLELLKFNVGLMDSYGLDTLYCPIKSYYHGTKWWFQDSYYVPAIYRVNSRTFKRVKSKLLCDPSRKMKEDNYYLSDMKMHHLTYRVDSIEEKRKGIRNSHYGELYDEYVDSFKNWQEGSPALVFGNDTQGNATLRSVKLYDSPQQKFFKNLPTHLQ